MRDNKGLLKALLIALLFLLLASLYFGRESFGSDKAMKNNNIELVREV